MPLDIGELSKLPVVTKRKPRKKKPKIRRTKKIQHGSWKRLGTWWECKKCHKRVSTKTQSPIPKMVCGKCQKE